MNLAADPYGDTAVTLLPDGHQNEQKTRKMGGQAPITENRSAWIEFSIVHLRGRLKAMGRAPDRRRADARDTAGSNTR